MDLYTKMYQLLTRVAAHINNMENSERALDGPHFDDSRGQGRILSLLKEYGGLRVKDLEHLLGIRPQSLHELLKKLERSGYIRRVPSRKDRRVRIVMLTDKGKNLGEKKMKKDNLFTGFTPEELEDFRDYLLRLEENIEYSLNEGPRPPRHGRPVPPPGEPRPPRHERPVPPPGEPRPPRHGRPVPPPGEPRPHHPGRPVPPEGEPRPHHPGRPVPPEGEPRPHHPGRPVPPPGEPHHAGRPLPPEGEPGRPLPEGRHPFPPEGEPRPRRERPYPPFAREVEPFPLPPEDEFLEPAEVDREIGAVLREIDPTLFDALAEALGLVDDIGPDEGLEERIQRNIEELYSDFGEIELFEEPESKPKAKPEEKPEPKPEDKPEPKPEDNKPEDKKPEPKDDKADKPKK